MVQKVAVKRDFEARLEILSVNPAVNGYFFELGKDKAAKGMGWAPPLFICAQDTMGL